MLRAGIGHHQRVQLLGLTPTREREREPKAVQHGHMINQKLSIYKTMNQFKQDGCPSRSARSSTPEGPPRPKLKRPVHGPHQGHLSVVSGGQIFSSFNGHWPIPPLGMPLHREPHAHCDYCRSSSSLARSKFVLGLVDVLRLGEVGPDAEKAAKGEATRSLLCPKLISTGLVREPRDLHPPPPPVLPDPSSSRGTKEGVIPPLFSPVRPLLLHLLFLLFLLLLPLLPSLASTPTLQQVQPRRSEITSRGAELHHPPHFPHKSSCQT